MKCPACNRYLKQVNAVGVVVDICEGGCGGIWFDQSELDNFDEDHEYDGGVLFAINKDPNIIVDMNKKRYCPRCRDVVMYKHFFSFKREIEVDECHNCAGIWLDYGELSQIRKQFNTEKERAKATTKYLDQLVKKECEPIHTANKEKLLKTRKIVETLLSRSAIFP